MKTITPQQAAEADSRTAQQFAETVARHNITDPLTLFELHRATWRGNAGADVVRVEPVDTGSIGEPSVL